MSKNFAEAADYAEGLATNFGIWSAARTRWVRNTLWPEARRHASSLSNQGCRRRRLRARTAGDPAPSYREM